MLAHFYMEYEKMKMFTVELGVSIFLRVKYWKTGSGQGQRCVCMVLYGAGDDGRSVVEYHRVGLTKPGLRSIIKPVGCQSEPILKYLPMKLII